MFKATTWIMTENKSSKEVIDNHLEELILSDMNNEELKQIIAQAVSYYGTTAKLALAEKAADILTEMLKDYGFVTETKRESWVDFSIAAVYLHNLFYKEGDWTTVFDARKNLTQIFDGKEVPEPVYDAIFQMIESQLGEKMPISKCRVVRNGPGELFYWSIWFAKNLLDTNLRDIESFKSDGPVAAVVTDIV